MTDPAEFDKIHLTDFPPLHLDDNGEKLHPFYKIAFSRQWKDTSITLLLNEIRRSNPETDTNEKNRACLGKLQAFMNMIDIEYSTRNLKAESEKMEDELPDIREQGFRPDAHLEE